MRLSGKGRWPREEVAAVELLFDLLDGLAQQVGGGAVGQGHVAIGRGDCALVLTDGRRIKLSRSRRKDFEALFAQPRT